MKKLLAIVVLGLLWSGSAYSLTLECTEKSKTIPSDVRHIGLQHHAYVPKIIIILDNNGSVHVTSYKFENKKIVKDTENFFLIEKKVGGKIQTNRALDNPLEKYGTDNYYKINLDTMEVLHFGGIPPEHAKIINEDRPKGKKVADVLNLYFTDCKNISSDNEGSGAGLKIKRKSPDFKTSEKDIIEKKKYVEKKKWKWKKIYTKKGESLITSSGVEYAGITYIDESTISETIVGKNYKTRSFYNVVNLANQVGNSSSIIFETKVDCKTKKYINDYMQFFSEPFGKGITNMHKGFESSTPNNFWNKGTRMHSLGEYACKVKPASTSNITSIIFGKDKK